jgi:hypothetical protein
MERCDDVDEEVDEEKKKEHKKKKGKKKDKVQDGVKDEVTREVGGNLKEQIGSINVEMASDRDGKHEGQEQTSVERFAEVPVRKQVQVPMITVQQKIVEVPQVELVVLSVSEIDGLLPLVVLSVSEIDGLLEVPAPMTQEDIVHAHATHGEEERLALEAAEAADAAADAAKRAEEERLALEDFGYAGEQAVSFGMAPLQSKLGLWAKAIVQAEDWLAQEIVPEEDELLEAAEAAADAAKRAEEERFALGLRPGELAIVMATAEAVGLCPGGLAKHVTLWAALEAAVGLYPGELVNFTAHAVGRQRVACWLTNVRFMGEATRTIEKSEGVIRRLGK